MTAYQKRHGLWVQGFHRDMDNEWDLCTALLGAPLSTVKTVEKRIKQRYPDRYDPNFPLERFNDHPMTTEDEVISCLDFKEN